VPIAEPAEHISPLPIEHLAVLVIDVQAVFFCSDPPPFEANEVIGRINSVTDKARAATVPVIFVRHEESSDADSRVSLGWEFHPHLNVGERETVIRKKTGDAFHGTNLESILRSADIQSLLLMGYATDFCVDSTLRNAVSKDFEIFVVSDAHTTNDGPVLNASLIRRHFNWVWSDSPSNRGIHLLSSSRVEFSASSAYKKKAAPQGAA